MKQGIRALPVLLLLLCLLALPRIRTDAAAAGGEWKQKGDQWYYYENGAPVSGWKTIGGRTYYLDPGKGGAMATGFKTIKTGGSTDTYYFMDKSYSVYSASEEGQMMTGFKTILVSGVKYVFYFSDSRYPSRARGSMLTGFKTIGGNRYYFADSRYPACPKGARLSGFKTISGSRYYFADSRLPSCKYKGKIVTGFNVLGGKVYFFAADGAQQKDWASKNVIVIDPGHSSQIPDGQVPVGPGSDEMKDADNYGAVSITNGLHEYELVLDVSLKLRDALAARGYKVVMVRTTNKGVYSCIDRAAVANKNNAAVFLRVHANAAPKDHSKNGAMTICISKKNRFIPQMYTKSRQLSDLMLKSYVKATGCYNEGVMESDDLIANNWSKVPTTLIELGYMTNAKEDKLMQTAAYKKKMVSGMVNGIDAYFAASAK